MKDRIRARNPATFQLAGKAEFNIVGQVRKIMYHPARVGRFLIMLKNKMVASNNSKIYKIQSQIFLKFNSKSYRDILKQNLRHLKGP